jgi:hypothetical protein
VPRLSCATLPTTGGRASVQNFCDIRYEHVSSTAVPNVTLHSVVRVAISRTRNPAGAPRNAHCSAEQLQSAEQKGIRTYLGALINRTSTRTGNQHQPETK